MAQVAIKKAQKQPRKPRQAEKTLQQKYYETLAQIDAIKGPPLAKKTTKIRIKRTQTLIATDGNDEGIDSEHEYGASPNGISMLASNFLDSQITVNKNFTVTEASQSTSILQSKFGVTDKLNIRAKGQSVFNSTTGNGQGIDVLRLATNGNGSIQGVGQGRSITNQIFIEDEQLGTVLPMQTESKAVAGSVDKAEVQTELSKGGQRLGFKSYLEQEQLDRASINDLIGSQSAARLIRKPREQRAQQFRSVPASVLKEAGGLAYGISSIKDQSISGFEISPVKEQSIAEMSKQRESFLRRQSIATVESKISRRTATAGLEAAKKRGSLGYAESLPASRLGRDDQKSDDSSIGGFLERNMTVVQHFQPEEHDISQVLNRINSNEPSVFQGGAAPLILHETDEEDDYKVTIQPEKRRQSKFNTRNDQVVGRNSVSVPNEGGSSCWRRSVDSRGKALVLRLPVGERPDSRSSMGRVVADLLKQDTKQVPADHQSVRSRHHVSKLSQSVDVSGLLSGAGQAGIDSKVIKQKSAMIKHDFDAGQSQLTQRHQLTQKAHLRMQQLIAMLRDKTGRKHLVNEDIESEPEMTMPGSAKEEQSPRKTRRLITVESSEIDADDFTSFRQQSKQGSNMRYEMPRPVPGKLGSAELDDYQLEKLKNSQDGIELSTIENKIRANLDKFKSMRDVYGSKKKPLDGPTDVVDQTEADGQDKGEKGDDSFWMGGTVGKDKDYRSQRYDTEGNAQETKNDVKRALFIDGEDHQAEVSVKDEGTTLESLNGDHIRLGRSRDTRRTALNMSLDAGHLSRTSKNTAALRLSQFVTSPLSGNQPVKRIINTGLLTSIPRRGRMVDTQKYIRENLQAYADNRYFAFTKTPKDLNQTLDPENMAIARRKLLSKGSKRRNLILGSRPKQLQTLDDQRFISASVSIAPLTSVADVLKRADGSSKTRNKSRGSRNNRNLCSTLDYEPIVQKKRVRKNIRVSKSRKAKKEPLGEPQPEEVADPEALAAAEMRDLKIENAELRLEVVEMVKVFEQYLKVAALKETAERKQEQQFKDEAEGSMAFGSVPKMDHDDDSEDELDSPKADTEGPLSEVPPKVVAMNQTGMPSVPPDSKLQMYPEDRPLDSRKQTERNYLNIVTDSTAKLQPSDSAQLSSINKPTTKMSKRRSPGKLAQSEQDIANLSVLQHSEGFFMNHHMPFIKSPREDTQTLALGPINKKPTSSQSRRSPKRVRSFSVQKRVELPQIRASGVTGKLSLLAASEHKIQNEWLRKIRALSDQLQTSINFENVVRVEGQIKEGKQKARLLKHENMKESARLISLQLKVINKSKTKAKPAIVAKQERRLAMLQKKITKETERTYEFNSWGFHSHIIGYVVKVRILEDLVDCAQRCAIKPDIQLERELWLMKRFQQQTWDDIGHFLDEREKTRWRTWDNPRNLGAQKPILAAIKLKKKGLPSDLKDVDKLIGQESEDMRDYLARLIKLDQDYEVHIRMARECVQFVNFYVGSSAWLTLSRIKAHRIDTVQRDEAIVQKLDDLRNESSKKPEKPVTQLNWLQLTAGNQDIKVTDKPTWMLLVEQQKIEDQARIQQEEAEATAKAQAEKLRLAEEHQEVAAKSQSGTEGDATKSGKEGPAGINLLSEGDALVLEDSNDEKEPSQARLSRMSAPNEATPKDEKAGSVEDLLEAERLAQEEQTRLEERLKEEAELRERQEMEEKQRLAIKHVSKWQMTIAKEKQQREERKRHQDEARAKRLARLFGDEQESDSSDGEVMNANLDRGAANAGYSSLMDKVDVHLQVEMAILQKWKQKDASLGVPSSPLPEIKTARASQKSSPFKSKEVLSPRETQARTFDQTGDSKSAALGDKEWYLKTVQDRRPSPLSKYSQPANRIDEEQGEADNELLQKKLKIKQREQIFIK